MMLDSLIEKTVTTSIEKSFCKKVINATVVYENNISETEYQYIFPTLDILPPTVTLSQMGKDYT